MDSSLRSWVIQVAESPLHGPIEYRQTGKERPYTSSPCPCPCHSPWPWPCPSPRPLPSPAPVPPPPPPFRPSPSPRPAYQSIINNHTFINSLLGAVWSPFLLCPHPFPHSFWHPGYIILHVHVCRCMFQPIKSSVLNPLCSEFSKCFSIPVKHSTCCTCTCTFLYMCKILPTICKTTGIQYLQMAPKKALCTIYMYSNAVRKGLTENLKCDIQQASNICKCHPTQALCTYHAVGKWLTWKKYVLWLI